MLKRRKFKRTLAIADLHCGHIVGLTPPKWNVDMPGVRDGGTFAMRELIWDWFEKKVDLLRPIDRLLVAGDAIDGDAEKGGGVEELYLDRTDQVNMAVDVVDFINPEGAIEMVYGTGYHTGNVEDWEDLVAQRVGANIGSVAHVTIGGKVFNMRHHVGRSSVPHGRYTAIAKEVLWDGLWADRGEYPKADFLLRAHVHYHRFIGDGTFIAMTLPALTGYGGKFGPRRVTGTVDIGLVWFDDYSNGKMIWESELCRLPLHLARSL